MRRFNRNRNYKLRVFLCVLLIVITVFAVYFIKMQPLIVKSAESNAKSIMLNCANESVISVLETENISYGDLVKLTYNDDGYVTSLEIDVYKVNYFKSLIANRISQAVADKEYYDVNMPIGALFGGAYTSGYGPRFTVKTHITSTAYVDFKHEFKSAGINQVLHIITVEINLTGNLVAAGYNNGITAKTSAVVAQTVIVGKSPDAFTNVIEGGDDTLGGLINDYGAEGIN